MGITKTSGRQRGWAIVLAIVILLNLVGGVLLCMPTEAKAANSAFVIFIHPGHSPASTGSGAVAGDIKEATINEAVSIKLGEKLQAEGYTVYLTNPTKQSTSLKTIIPATEKPLEGQYNYGDQVLPAACTPEKYGVNVTPNLILDIHHNSSTSSSARGIEVYYNSNYSVNTDYPNMNYGKTKEVADASKAAANIINAQFRNDLKYISTRSSILDTETTGVKNSLCRNADIPSVLVEAGYMSNATELSAICNSANQDALVASLVKAINTYKTYDQTPPTATGVTPSAYTAYGKSFDVNAINVRDVSGVAKVEFAVWNAADSSTLKWYNGSDFKNGNWGITLKRSDLNNILGTYVIHAYATDMLGNKGFIGGTTVNMVKEDTTPPTAAGVTSSASIVYCNAFEVYAIGTADTESGVGNVKFAVWSKADQSDMKWFRGVDYGNTNWGAQVSRKDIGNVLGTYYVHAYAEDKVGNSAFVGGTIVNIVKEDKTAPAAVSIQPEATEVNKNTFDVNAMQVSDTESGVAKVEFAVWSKTDQSDIKWYSGSDFKNGNWGITANVVNHKNNTGTYNIHVYATDKNGNRGFIGATTVNVLKDTVPPIASSITSSVKNTYGSTFEAYAINVHDDRSGVAKVEFAVWSKADQSDIKWYSGSDFKNGNWGITANIVNHKNNTGTYSIHVYATDGSGNRGLVGATTVNVLKDTVPPTASSILAPVKETYGSSFEVYAMNVADNHSGVAKVEFAVWSKADQSDMKWYSGSDFKNGNWGITANIANHNKNYGMYNVHVYATDGSGNRGFVGATTINVLKDTVPPTASSVTVPEREVHGTIFFVNAMDVTDDHSGVAKVEFAVWSKADQSDMKWYSGSDFKNGNWGITANIANHNKNYGMYNVHVYATDGSGNRGFVGATTVNVLKDTTPASMSSMSITPETITDEFTVTMYGLKAGTGIEKVECAVWNSRDTAGQKWYDAISYNNGNWYRKVNISDFDFEAGTYYIHIYATDGDGNRSFVGGETVSVQGTHKIMGTSSVTKEQLVNYYISKAPGGLSAYPQEYVDKGVNLNRLAELYVQEAAAEGVKVEVAWAQMCLETGYLKFGGDVQVGQFNFAGLGATGNGVPGFNFAEVYGDNSNGILAGVRGHIQHLKCYASTGPVATLNSEGKPYDPRWSASLRGKAPTVELLEGTWAMSKGYAANLIAIMDRIQAASGAVVVMGIEPGLESAALEESTEPSASPSATPEISAAPSANPSVTPEESTEPSAGTDAEVPDAV
ncbi:MAG: GBS Bsp-like repeat-containing protein [Christensenella sp.]|nr:GBS Bsp-like repeat-containing protein [Christensenella sp.]